MYRLPSPSYLGYANSLSNQYGEPGYFNQGLEILRGGAAPLLSCPVGQVYDSSAKKCVTPPAVQANGKEPWPFWAKTLLTIGIVGIVGWGVYRLDKGLRAHSPMTA